MYHTNVKTLITEETGCKVNKNSLGAGSVSGVARLISVVVRSSPTLDFKPHIGCGA